jgi:hypothetical protein
MEQGKKPKSAMTMHDIVVLIIGMIVITLFLYAAKNYENCFNAEQNTIKNHSK